MCVGRQEKASGTMNAKSSFFLVLSGQISQYAYAYVCMHQKRIMRDKTYRTICKQGRISA